MSKDFPDVPGFPSVSRMDCGAVTAQSIHYDFKPDDYPEKWDLITPDPSSASVRRLHAAFGRLGYDDPPEDPFGMTRAQLLELVEDEEDFDDLKSLTDAELLEVVVGRMQDEDIEGLEELRDYFNRRVDDDRDSFSPMMNTIYPLPYFEDDAGEAQFGLLTSPGNVCLVEVNGETYMALTGGGMDMSWDICGGYMLLGYLPPVEFAARLPDYAGQALSDRNLWILQGCLRSCEVNLLWAQQSVENAARQVRRLVRDAPESMPLPVLHDWLLDQDRPEEAARVRLLLPA